MSGVLKKLTLILSQERVIIKYYEKLFLM